jgi:hypothetical protein
MEMGMMPVPIEVADPFGENFDFVDDQSQRTRTARTARVFRAVLCCVDLGFVLAPVSTVETDGRGHEVAAGEGRCR